MTGKRDPASVDAIDTPQGLVLVYDRGRPTQRTRISYVPEQALATRYAILSGGVVERTPSGRAIVVFAETQYRGRHRWPIAVEVTSAVPGLAELVRLVELVEAGAYAWDD